MLKWGLVNLSNGDIVKILDPIFYKVPYLYRDIPEWKNENRFVVYWVVSDFKMNQGSFNPLSSISHFVRKKKNLNDDEGIMKFDVIIYVRLCIFICGK